MSQSKRHSALETATNTAVGFGGSYLITLSCFHLESHIATTTLYATLGCTVWSLLRGYYLRRLFNHLHVKAALKPHSGITFKLTTGVPEGWAVDWPEPYEADLAPCPVAEDGYHTWPMAFEGHVVKCCDCGVEAGLRVTTEEVV